MTFAPFAVATKPASAGTGISASLKLVRKATLARLSLAINAATAATLGFSDKDMLEVLIGAEEHHGLIRLRKNNSVGTAVVSRRNGMKSTTYFAVALGHVPNFVNRSEAKRWCQFEQVEQGWVEIVLPSWADETGKVKRLPPPAAGHVQAPVAKRSSGIIGGMMGDPPPDRSALNARLGKV